MSKDKPKSIEPENPMQLFEDVASRLKLIYKQKILPLERRYKFHDVHSPAFLDADFDAKPTILLLGQYSSGKTTFIKYVLQSDFPGARIGPEPTTDKFIAVTYGNEDRVIPGNALALDTNLNFHSLSRFGSTFLNRFQCSQTKADLLQCLTFIDTPGILASTKRGVERGYDLSGVLEWFAERVDRIILLFDVHQLDISDELQRCIVALKHHEDKIRIVLNKADSVNEQQLVRVYGALMWSLGKVLAFPESVRVYIGTFWDQPFKSNFNRKLLEDEEEDLIQDLQSLPRDAALRRVNDLIKRTRLAKVQAYIISHLKQSMPAVLGKEAKKKQLISNLGNVYKELQQKHSIAASDFPDIEKMQLFLRQQDFNKFYSLDPRLLTRVNEALEKDLSSLLQQITKLSTSYSFNRDVVEVEDSPEPDVSPFSPGGCEGADEGRTGDVWIPGKQKYIDAFNSLQPLNGKIGGAKGKKEMIKSKLPNSVLGKVWHLSDVDKDGLLDVEEFSLAMHLIQIKLDGYELPNKLPSHLMPPSHKGTTQSAQSNTIETSVPRTENLSNDSNCEEPIDNLAKQVKSCEETVCNHGRDVETEEKADLPDDSGECEEAVICKNSYAVIEEKAYLPDESGDDNLMLLSTEKEERAGIPDDSSEFEEAFIGTSSYVVIEEKAYLPYEFGDDVSLFVSTEKEEITDIPDDSGECEEVFIGKSSYVVIEEKAYLPDDSGDDDSMLMVSAAIEEIADIPNHAGECEETINNKGSDAETEETCVLEAGDEIIIQLVEKTEAVESCDVKSADAFSKDEAMITEGNVEELDWEIKEIMGINDIVKNNEDEVTISKLDNQNAISDSLKANEDCTNDKINANEDCSSQTIKPHENLSNESCSGIKSIDFEEELTEEEKGKGMDVEILLAHASTVT